MTYLNLLINFRVSIRIHVCTLIDHFLPITLSKGIEFKKIRLRLEIFPLASQVVLAYLSLLCVSLRFIMIFDATFTLFLFFLFLAELDTSLAPGT